MQPAQLKTGHVSPIPFGTLLQQYRVAAALSQEALAERAGLSVAAISVIERGKRGTPRLETVALLADALALGPDDRATFVAASRATSGSAAEQSVPFVNVAPAATNEPPFVGRARELALLERHLAGEGPPLLLFAGEPGIGKTRLLHASCSQAHARGRCVLESGCQRRGGQQPYAPLLGALQRYISSREPGQLRTELQGCAWLVRLLPELADGPIEPLPTWTLTPEHERRLMFDAVLSFLRSVAGQGGALLVLDDLQWAGSDALDLLTTVVRSVADPSLRIIGAYRDTEVHDHTPLSLLLSDLAHAGLVVRQPLGPLTPAETAVLVDGLLREVEGFDDTVRERVVERSGGVPFFVLSCVQGLHVEARPEATAAATGDVPWSVAQSVRQRVAALPPPAQDVLRATAVFGRSARRPLLIALSAQPPGEVLDALDAACHGRLLEEDGPDTYRFAHDVVREVVEGDLSAARRAALHQRVAEVLEALPGAPPAEALAYHYGQSDAQDKAVQYLEQVGDLAVARSALGAAESYYRDLAQRLEALGRHLDAAHAYAKLGLLLQQTENSALTIAALQQAEAAFARSQAASAPRPRGTTLLDQYVAAGAHAELYLASSALAQVQDRLSASMTLAQRAVEMAHEAGDVRTQAQALLQRGNAELKSGHLDEAVATLNEMRWLCEEMGGLGLLNNVFNVLFFVHELRGDFEQAGHCIAQNLQIVETIGDPALLVGAIYPRACLEIDIGDWERGRADLEHLIDVSPSFAADSYVVANLGYLSMVEGDWDTAAAQLGEALDRSATIGDMNARVMVERMLAELELLQERPAAALARLRALLDLDEIHDTVFLLPLVAWAHLQMGALDEAEAMSRRAIARVHAEQSLFVLPDALLVRAMVLTERRQWTDAKLAVEEGLALARRMPYPYAEARLLQVYGQLHAARGEMGPAQERWEAALAIFKRLGARKDVEDVERAMTGLQQL